VLYAAETRNLALEQTLEETEAILESLFEEWQLTPLETNKLRATVVRFGRRLCEQYLKHRMEIDQRIETLSQGWALDRMPTVDRNILRMALTELLYLPDVPLGATIDEAVDLAKEYGTADSGKFVNGILGAVARELHGRRRAQSSEVG
jgi:N utilization substance protein B